MSRQGRSIGEVSWNRAQVQKGTKKGNYRWQSLAFNNLWRAHRLRDRPQKGRERVKRKAGVLSWEEETACKDAIVFLVLFFVHQTNVKILIGQILNIILLNPSRSDWSATCHDLSSHVHSKFKILCKYIFKYIKNRRRRFEYIYTIFCRTVGICHLQIHLANSTNIVTIVFSFWVGLFQLFPFSKDL